MAQQIAISSGFAKCAIRFLGALTNRKCYRTFRIGFMYGRDDRDHTGIGVVRVFPTLKHKCAKAKSITFFATLKNFFFGKAVPIRKLIASTNTAIKAIILTIISEFDQTAFEHSFAIALVPQCASARFHIFRKVRGTARNKVLPFTTRESVFTFELTEQGVQRIRQHNLRSFRIIVTTYKRPKGQNLIGNKNLTSRKEHPEKSGHQVQCLP